MSDNFGASNYLRKGGRCRWIELLDHFMLIIVISFTPQIIICIPGSLHTEVAGPLLLPTYAFPFKNACACCSHGLVQLRDDHFEECHSCSRYHCCLLCGQADLEPTPCEDTLSSRTSMDSWFVEICPDWRFLDLMDRLRAFRISATSRMGSCFLIEKSVADT